MFHRDNAIKNLLARNVEDVIEKSHLEKALQSGKKLRVKLGIDPTSPDLHLGHAVVLRKLREFQDLGHKVVLIIGDFTAHIGDPSGRNEARPPLGTKEIAVNEKKYLAQAGKVMNIRKAEVVHNSKWFEKEGIERVIKLAGAGSMQQVLRRADFKKRLDAGQDITMVEMLYPLLQGYDSVKVKADVEIGGTDQLFNLLMGRRVQRHFGVPEQDILTVPLLVGTDGSRKMSKSYGNYIALDDTAGEIFGKIMSLPDALTKTYFTLCTDLDLAEIKKLKKALSPRDFKMRLGVEIAVFYHGEALAERAREKWEGLFSKKTRAPSDLPTLKLSGVSLSATDLVLRTNVTKSKSEARRLITQGAVSINNSAVRNPKQLIEFLGGEILKIGKHRFFRVR